MDFKDILNAVLGESGFIQKDAFAQSNDPDDKQMITIANRVASDIVNWCNWSSLRKQDTITMTSETTYPLPSDFQTLVPDSVWETDGSRRVELPVPENRWFMYKFSTFSDGGTLRARIYGKNIELYDTQPGEEFAYEYVSNSAITDSEGVPKPKFTADTDLFVLDDNALIKGIQAKWAKAKMMPQANDWYGDFQRELANAKGRDTGGRTIGGATGTSDWVNSRQPYYPLWRR
jgi:hypothetical protein